MYHGLILWLKIIVKQQHVDLNKIILYKVTNIYINIGDTILIRLPP
jgi:hypothetical protein